MRVALKIAYDGREFYGHQRQPDARTVEGECLAGLRAAHILSDPGEAFFRSASRTDRGVSAIGNVIAFNANMRPEAVLGAFNGKVHRVWAWAFASVPEAFHPRVAVERWYRYHLLRPPPLERLREAAAAFEGPHDFRWFTSDPPSGPFTIRRVEVAGGSDFARIDVRARSFRRGMVRRIVAAMLARARGEVSLADIEHSLDGVQHDFGTVSAEPLTLMDVQYTFSFTSLLKPKVLEEWDEVRTDLCLRSQWMSDLRAAAGLDVGQLPVRQTETAPSFANQ